jgi:hypothetical protein
LDFRKNAKIPVAFVRAAGYTLFFSLPLVKDGGLAIRYLPHLESTVVLEIHKHSLSFSEQKSAVGSL